MANSTLPILEILQAADIRELVLAFCLSMVVGLLLGALVYMLLTWMSRRKASASITRPTTRSGNRPSNRSSSPRSRPSFHRTSGTGSTTDRRSNNSLASAAFSLHRQGSAPDTGYYGDEFGRKSSFRASTFHPLLQVSHIARQAEEGSQSQQATLPRTHTLTLPANSPTNNTTTPGATPTTTPAPAIAAAVESSVSSIRKPRPDSFWGNPAPSGLESPQQTPPPAYNSIIRAYQESRT
ncbi:myc target protein 1 homolog [Engraulis encrasicolus]|uniref:myc target protein 1 homolog n=1 Tax=Engraulis encrasicolus TaxID=184585 RepID=UPI002FD5A673